MAQQNINTGTAANDGQGDSLRDAFLATEANFTELYADVLGLDTDKIEFISAPSTASDTGTTGQVAYDSDYVYICTATDTWKRVAIATW